VRPAPVRLVLAGHDDQVVRLRDPPRAVGAEGARPGEVPSRLARLRVHALAALRCRHLPDLLEAPREQELGDRVSRRSVGARADGHGRHRRDDAALPVDLPLPRRRVGVRGTDAAAYFSGLGGMWDAVWIVYGVFSWRVLTRSYFEEHVYTADGFWPKVNRFVPTSALLVFYRAAFFYGTSRWIAWTVWAHVIHHYPYDLSWGGPHWVHAAHP